MTTNLSLAAFKETVETNEFVISFAKTLFSYDPATTSYRPFADINCETDEDTVALAAQAALFNRDDSTLSIINDLVLLTTYEHARTEAHFDAAVLYLSAAVANLMRHERAFSDTKHTLVD